MAILISFAQRVSKRRQLENDIFPFIHNKHVFHCTTYAPAMISLRYLGSLLKFMKTFSAIMRIFNCCIVKKIQTSGIIIKNFKRLDKNKQTILLMKCCEFFEQFVSTKRKNSIIQMNNRKLQVSTTFKLQIRYYTDQIQRFSNPLLYF